MSWYNRIQQAKVGGAGGTPPGPGDYIFQVLEVKEHHGQQGGTYFIIVLLVLQSSNPEHPPGSQRSQVIRLDGKFPDTALGDVKGFAAGALGLDPKDPRTDHEITPQVIAGILHPAQPVAGHVVGANVWLKPAKQPGSQPFTKFGWKPILENGQPKRLPLPAGFTPSVNQPAQGYAPPAQGYGPPPGQLPYHPQAAMMGQGYQPNMAPPAQFPPAQFPPAQFPPAQTGGFPPPFSTTSMNTPAGPPPGYTPAGARPPQGAPAFPWQPGPAAAPAAPPLQFPPAGWQTHPQAPGWFWDGKPGGRVLSEGDLRTLMAAGQA
jgi:hypothetical protein